MGCAAYTPLLPKRLMSEVLFHTWSTEMSVAGAAASDGVNV
jgi:hypothetical protein